ncbi:MAG TPA: class III extradiol ring-cleavage dioxygenase [Gallionella sp.]|nr:class III extradiol ring-cleavage dioxygenase [Gallionella sp.]
MSERMPVVFVSHGAPDALLKAPDAVASWGEISRALRKPAAILVVSAHWEARQPTVSQSMSPETIHDFPGFSPALYQMHYRAPGAPALAERVMSLLSDAGFAARFEPDRGLDHGAWVPLSAMYPQADVPVTQLSMIRSADPATHFELGRALAPLRDEGVLIVGSGAITHNFAWLDWRAGASEAPLPQAQLFSDWVASRLEARDIPALLAYRAARYGAESHPTEDHFLPLFVALGAALEDIPLRYQPRFAYGGLSMDAYLWANSARQN